MAESTTKGGQPEARIGSDHNLRLVAWSILRYLQVAVAAKTITNFVEKASRLYEQDRSAVLAVTALEMYVSRWMRWTTRLSGNVSLPWLSASYRWATPNPSQRGLDFFPQVLIWLTQFA